MPAPEAKLNGTLQESVLTLLVHDDVQGRVAAQIITAAAFEGDYRVVAERVLAFWKRYGEAPKAHIDDELSDLLTEGSRKAVTYQRIIRAMLTLSEHLNAHYVLSRLETFARMQQLKLAVMSSAEQLKKNEDLAVEEIEAVWQKLLYTRRSSFEPGVRLSEYDKMLASMLLSEEFTTGIKPLDDRFITPMRESVLLFLGAYGKGKTWFLVSVGKQALMARKRVLHITLEMSDWQVQQRYYQNYFAISKRALVDSKGRPLAFRNTVLEFDDTDEDDPHNFIGLDFEDVVPDFSLDSDMVREELSVRVDQYEQRFRNLVIKQWAPRQLTVQVLNAYLDQLEIVEGFIPDMIICDYMGLWKTDADNHRITLGRAFEDFRGVCVERKVAGVTANQLSKQGAAAIEAHGLNVAEDFSMMGTADVVLVYSVTDYEYEYGLARLLADKARGEGDRFSVLLTQNYNIGQFALDAVRLPRNYFNVVPAKSKLQRGMDQDEGDDEEDDKWR